MLSWHYRLTLDTEFYWYINSTELTLYWTLHNTERASGSERYSWLYISIPQNIKNNTMTFHTTQQFHTTISHHTLFFTTPFCTTSHSVVHPGHSHSTSYNIPFHITPYNKYISSVASFKSALKDHLFSSGLCLLCLCAWSWMPLLSCVCVFQPHSTSQVL